MAAEPGWESPLAVGGAAAELALPALQAAPPLAAHADLRQTLLSEYPHGADLCHP